MNPSLTLEPLQSTHPPHRAGRPRRTALGGNGRVVMIIPHRQGTPSRHFSIKTHILVTIPLCQAEHPPRQPASAWLGWRINLIIGMCRSCWQVSSWLEPGRRASAWADDVLHAKQSVYENSRCKTGKQGKTWPFCRSLQDPDTRHLQRRGWRKEGEEGDEKKDERRG